MNVIIKQILLFSLIIIFGVSCKSDAEKTTVKDSSFNESEISDKLNKDLSKGELMELVSPGKIAPAGKLRDINNEELDLKDFKDNFLVVYFWATYCSPCLKGLPEFMELSANYDVEHVKFIAISIDEEYDYWQEYLIEHNLTTNNYWLGADESNKVTAFTLSKIEIENKMHLLSALPKSVILSDKGEIIMNDNIKMSASVLNEHLGSYTKL